MSCCNHAEICNEELCLIELSNPNVDSWMQIFSCLSQLSNISLDALIVPWMRRFTSQSAKVVHSHLHSGISLDGFVFATYLCLQRMFVAAEPVLSSHFILPVRFSYLGLLRMRTSRLHNFYYAEQQYLIYLHYCKGRFRVGVGVHINKT